MGKGCELTDLKLNLLEIILNILKLLVGNEGLLELSVLHITGRHGCDCVGDMKERCGMKLV